MTPQELRQLRAKVGITQIEMARVAGVSTRTYQRWERIAVPEPAARLIGNLYEGIGA